MFELNKSIKKWKDDLNNNQSLNTSDVTELQLHLEDTIENLREKGLSQEEAFWVAKHRVGDSDALSTEYAKVNLADLWKKRILWLLSGYFLIVTASNIFDMCAILLHIFNIPLTMFKISFFGVKATFPVPLYVFTFIIGGVIFLLTSRKNIRGKTAVNRLCSSLEKKNYQFIIILFGLYLVTTVGSTFLILIFTRIYDPAAFGTIFLSSNIFSTLGNISLIALAGIFTFQLSVKKKKYETV